MPIFQFKYGNDVKNDPAYLGSVLQVDTRRVLINAEDEHLMRASISKLVTLRRGAADDWLIGCLALIAGKGMQQLRMYFCFIHPRFADLHGTLMGRLGNARRLSHDGNFCSALEQTHFMQTMVERDDFVRCQKFLACLGPKLVHPAYQDLVKIRIFTKIVINSFATMQ